MNGRTRKPVGWRLEPGRHSLASRGIKTGQKRYQRKPRAYKSPQPLAPPESTDFFTTHRGEQADETLEGMGYKLSEVNPGDWDEIPDRLGYTHTIEDLQ